jgi:hypothetical protein
MYIASPAAMHQDPDPILEQLREHLETFKKSPTVKGARALYVFLDVMTPEGAKAFSHLHRLVSPFQRGHFESLYKDGLVALLDWISHPSNTAGAVMLYLDPLWKLVSK